ncbi:MAG: DUF2934 domain-containing protein [Cyanobacteria bacterium P01_H01_bin.15]
MSGNGIFGGWLQRSQERRENDKAAAIRRQIGSFTIGQQKEIARRKEAATKELAYKLWELDGCPENCGERYWNEAQQKPLFALIFFKQPLSCAH